MVKMRDKNFFYISGIASFLIYFILFVIVLIYLKSSQTVRYDAGKRVSVLELSLVSDKLQSNDDTHVSQSEDEDKMDTLVKNSSSVSVKRKTQLKSLFAQVNTKEDSTIEKDNVNNEEGNNLASRLKSRFNKRKKGDISKISKYLNSVKTKTTPMVLVSKSGKKNKYYSKIYNILSSRWNPLFIMNGLSAKVLITINRRGVFSYKFLRTSGNEIFDGSLRAFLKSQVKEKFPISAKGGSTDIEFTFKTKEK